MIISASRRTDLPAFYSDWFMNRIKAGFCEVANPFNPAQISRVPLTPDQVDCIVFWTRNPGPLTPHLDELDRLGLNYYFLFTILGHPKKIDPKCPPLETSLRTCRDLSKRLGPGRVVWRYDPILISPLTDINFHLNNFTHIARGLRGLVKRCVISLMQPYRKLGPRIAALAAQGAPIRPPYPEETSSLLPHMAAIARENNISIQSCSSQSNWSDWGIQPGKCVDNELIRQEFGLTLPTTKDPGQRKDCRCVKSRDIGAYDTCLFGCAYCYATSNLKRAAQNHHAHNPLSPSLLDKVKVKGASGGRGE